MMPRESLDYWLALTMIDGLGQKGVDRLLEAFHGPEEVFSAAGHELQTRCALSPEVAVRISAFADWQSVAHERQLAEYLGAVIIPRVDERYPKNLLNIYDPPPILYCKGDLHAFAAPMVAIVGSRKASTHGRHFAFHLAGELAERNIGVASGMALGIDGAAHEGCLHTGGRTVAVWGSGLDVCYPARHRRLATEIESNGLLVSEVSFGSRPEKHHFPRRNRIISGLSEAVVVVEASLQSGSLITARCALEQGREVFAVPGLPGSAASRGSNWLIKEGAQLLDSADDLFCCLPRLQTIAEVGCTPAAGRVTGHSDEEKLLLAKMGPTEYSLDQLMEISGWTHDKVSSIVLGLELAGTLWRTDAGRFQRNPHHR
ncbi:MAG: DNA-processing protein DprA [Deltaproteobacteria bacterium]|nr:DNA-processing protein DprA [Candidatus Anaeroferrophillus wilburensis]MBN2888885.1 DNA-processing protein DprA [Deltaproteobacteria bacterium]